MWFIKLLLGWPSGVFLRGAAKKYSTSKSFSENSAYLAKPKQLRIVNIKKQRPNVKSLSNFGATNFIISDTPPMLFKILFQQLALTITFY